MLKKILCPRCRYSIEIDNNQEFSHCKICGLPFKTSTILDFENLKSSPQPKDGVVIYTIDKEEDSVSFFIPKRGFHWIDSYTLILASFMALFVFSISISSLQGFLTSIPFLLMIIFIVWKSIIFEATNEEKIILKSNELTIQESSFFSKNSYTISYIKIIDICILRVYNKGKLIQYKIKDSSSYSPTILWGIEESRFAFYLSLEEMDWLVREMKYHIFKKDIKLN